MFGTCAGLILLSNRLHDVRPAGPRKIRQVSWRIVEPGAGGRDQGAGTREQGATTSGQKPVCRRKGPGGGNQGAGGSESLE